MKYFHLILLLIFISCSKHVEKSAFEYTDILKINLSSQERFMSLKYSVGEIDSKSVLVTFNSINGDVKLIEIHSGKELFVKNIPLEGPNSIPEYFLVNIYVGNQKIVIVSDQGNLILLMDKNGEIINKVELPKDEEDHGYLYYSDGNMLFFENNNNLFISYFAGLFPNRDPNKDYYSLFEFSIEEKERKRIIPLSKENIEKFWGEGHMIICPFGTYSNHYGGFLTGFANSNNLKLYDIQGDFQKEFNLELKNWKKPVPTDLKYEDLASLSQESIYELRSHSIQQQKVWKILEMKEGFLVEVLEPVSESPLPRFSVHKFDLDFKYISTREFFDDHFTCYQSFVFEDKYHLVDLKAYQEDEDNLTFGVFAFDDL